MGTVPLFQIDQLKQDVAVAGRAYFAPTGEILSTERFTGFPSKFAVFE